MRIVVTGGCGYIGSHVIRALMRAGTRDIVVVDDLSTGDARVLPEGITLVVADIADAKAATALEGVDAVIHCAGKISVAESVADPRAYYRANVAAALVFLGRAIDYGVRRFVFSSSAAVYGNPRSVPIAEDHPLAPLSPYGESKRVIEAALESYAKAYGITSCSLRYFNAAGATPEENLGERHEPETHLIPLAVGAALGKRPALCVFGDGSCVRDYVHVEDLAEAHVRALEASGPINLGTGRGASVRQVIEAVERITGKKVPHTMAPPRQGDPAVLVASNDRAARLLGWKPKRDLYAIVRDVVRFESRAPS